MPALIADADLIYLRATPIPRALESVQQTFWGLYPLTARTAAFPPPTIVTRTPADETLFPNEGNCRRFAQLSRAFAQRTADRWNETDEVAYVTKLIGKWMPESSPKVAVDSHPRLSGIMDTINSTLAHGPDTMLPKEFYDKKSRAIIDKIGVEEWFSGYNENREYRTLGIGGLLGDLVERMGAAIEGTGLTMNEIGGVNGRTGTGRGGEQAIRMALSGCHDTTLAAVLTAMGAFNGESWPPYTSHIAIELFRKTDEKPEVPAAIDHTAKVIPAFQQNAALPPSSSPLSSSSSSTPSSSKPGWLASMLGLRGDSSSSISSSTAPKSSTAAPVTTNKPTSGPSSSSSSDTISRRAFSELSPTTKDKVTGYYVRMRYNDKIMTVPACQKPGNHLEGDESMCTFEAFKRVADGFTPKNWKRECGMNLEGEGSKVVGLEKGSEQWAGHIEEGY